LIAIGKYKHWHTLDGPKRDADALRDVLFRKYGFSPERTIELRDAAATNENILKAFRQWKDASPDDQLLIYYAGHGHTDDFDKTGFWIPHDAESDAGQRVRWLPNASIRGALAVLPFHHILLICDSCFSGDLLDVQRGVRINQHPPAKPDYIKNSLRKRSREVLTSGSSEPVSDAGLTGHSAFAFHLIDTLKTHPEPWIDAIRLYDHIRCGVSGQQPLYGWLNT